MGFGFSWVGGSECESDPFYDGVIAFKFYSDDCLSFIIGRDVLEERFCLVFGVVFLHVGGIDHHHFPVCDGTDLFQPVDDGHHGVLYAEWLDEYECFHKFLLFSV